MSDISNEELKENFDYFDNNSDGKLDQEEFSGLMQALGALDPGEDPGFGFRQIDSDRSGTVDFDEFVRWFTAR